MESEALGINLCTVHPFPDTQKIYYIHLHEWVVKVVIVGKYTVSVWGWGF